MGEARATRARRVGYAPDARRSGARGHGRAWAVTSVCDCAGPRCAIARARATRDGGTGPRVDSGALPPWAGLRASRSPPPVASRGSVLRARAGCLLPGAQKSSRPAGTEATGAAARCGLRRSRILRNREAVASALPSAPWMWEVRTPSSGWSAKGKREHDWKDRPLEAGNSLLFVWYRVSLCGSGCP